MEHQKESPLCESLAALFLYQFAGTFFKLTKFGYYQTFGNFVFD